MSLHLIIYTVIQKNLSRNAKPYFRKKDGNYKLGKKCFWMKKSSDLILN